LFSSIKTTIADTISLAESFVSNISATISEVITFSEIITRTIKTALSEVITFSETITKTVRIIISEIVSWIEALEFNIFERLKGVIGMIKEFVRISNKKEKVSAINVEEGVREELNNPYRQYDDSTLLYDQSEICYNNFISSEKPIFIISKKNNPVSVSSQKDKPSILKR